MLFLWLHICCTLLFFLTMLLSQIPLHKGIVVGKYGGFVRTTAGQHWLSMQTHACTVEELLLLFMISDGQYVGGAEAWLEKLE